jgi:hypothetical protein
MSEEENRPIMLICGKCGQHDLNGKVLLEIDFKNQRMGYVCRECTHENIILLKAIPPSFPQIGIGR